MKEHIRKKDLIRSGIAIAAALVVMLAAIGINKSYDNATMVAGKYTPGTYVGVGQGFGGDVEVTLEINQKGGIDSATLVGASETPTIGGAALEELQEDYIRPQESGSRCGCDYVRLTGEGIAFTAATADGEPFSFNASVFTQEELEEKRHNYELEPCGSTVLCIDHRMAGIGSKSCGPDLSEQYRIDEDTYRFAFLIRPERV